MPREADLSFFANLFLVAYALDVLLSLLDEALSRLSGFGGLGSVRAIVAQGVVLACGAVYVAALLTPRLPKRILLPPALFILWWSLGAVPLGLFLDSADARILFASTTQTLLGAAAFVLARRQSGRWLLARDALPRPAFRLRYTLGFAALHVLLVPLLGAGYLALALAEGLVRGTDGFVSFGVGGMSITERSYRRADREIVLVGMVHVGKGAFYRDLYVSFVEPSTVVLQEGVSDVEGRLAVTLSYEPLASAVGLRTQPLLDEVLEELRAEAAAEAEAWPHVWHADVDASELSEETIEFIQRIARVLNAPDPRAELEAFSQFVRSVDADTWTTLARDLLVLRNERVVAELDAALADYRRVVIPWGALHMPGIERQILERGFEPIAERRRIAAGYAAILAAVWEAVRVLSP